MIIINKSIYKQINMDYEKRQNIIEYINKYADDVKLSKKLERCAYDNIKHKISLDTNYMNEYNHNIKYLVSNIDIIIYKIKENKIKINDIFQVSSIDLLPEKWEDSKKRKLEEDKFHYGKKKTANTKTVKCSKCKENNIHVEYKQTRSADEPETCFYECLTCGKKWRK